MPQLNAASALELLHSVDAFLFDCDGVLWEGSHVIAGALETLTYLRKLGKKIVFVSNNSTKSRDALLGKIKSFGIEAYKEEVIGTAYAVATHLRSVGFTKKVHVLGESGIGEELRELGIPHNGIEEFRGLKPLEEAEDIVVDPDIGAVVVGLDTHLNYYKLAYANFCLHRIPDCIYICTNTDNTLPGRRGVLLPGGGTMAAALSLASNRQPLVIGKPERNMMDIILNKLNLSPSKVCMVGDRLETDILFGINGNTKTLLVFTGVATQAQVDSPTNTIRPDYYTPSLYDLLNLTSSAK